MDSSCLAVFSPTRATVAALHGEEQTIFLCSPSSLCRETHLEEVLPPRSPSPARRIWRCSQGDRPRRPSELSRDRVDLVVRFRMHRRPSALACPSGSSTLHEQPSESQSSHRLCTSDDAGVRILHNLSQLGGLQKEAGAKSPGSLFGTVISQMVSCLSTDQTVIMEGKAQCSYRRTCT